MSLKNGLKKRTPIWCWLMIAALAFVVLPGAVAQPRDDENALAAAPTVAEPESKRTTEHAGSVRVDRTQVTQITFEGNMFWRNRDLRKNLVSKETLLIFGAIYNPDTIPANIEALTLSLDADHIFLEFANSEQAMGKF